MKVWQLLPKLLLKEIHFPKSIQSAIFANDRLDLVVGYESLVSEITRDNYLPQVLLETEQNKDSIEVQLCSDKLMSKIQMSDEDSARDQIP